MCNYYRIEEERLQLALHFEAVPEEFDYGEVYPKSIAPVLIQRDEQRVLCPLAFGFTPAWSKSPLANARIENIESRTWSKPFRTRRCIVPMTHFREPCYWGAGAGKQVDFHATDGSLLLAAAIYFKDTFALLMRPALPFVDDTGHSRSPFFIDESGIDSWIDPSERSEQQCKDVLRAHAVEPVLEFVVAKEMAASWTSRRKKNLNKREQEHEGIKQNGPLGLGT